MKMTKLLLTMMLSVVAFAVTSCGAGPKTESELAGTWEVTRTLGEEDEVTRSIVMTFSLPDHDFSKQIIVEKPALDNVMILAYSGVWETEKENLRMYIDKESITVSFEGSYWEDKGVEKYEIKKAIIDNIERAEGPEEFTFTSRVTDKFKVKDIRGETFTYIRKD